MMAIEFNPFKVTEYRGFKVGDKAEVKEYPLSRSVHGKDPEDLTYPFSGTIERFEGGYGVNCEKIMSVVIGGYGFIIDRLLSTNNIKKLPKYAVGDVVRVKSLDQIRKELPNLETSEGIAFSIHPEWDMSKFCGKLVTLKPHKNEGMLTIEESTDGCNWDDQFIEPFDGFRIGDTVWTAKRGKGKIVDKTIFCQDPERPFIVRFEGESKDRCPKTCFMFPTERKMLESLPKMDVKSFSWGLEMSDPISFPGTMPDEVAKMLGYEMASHLRQATADLVRPKFKVDDDVFYKGSKWRVIGFRIEGYVLYTIRKGAITEFLIEESDLRLWQETKLTHCLQNDTDNWYKFHITMYRNLKYLGCICGHETFTAEDSRGNLALYRGIKGDDIS